MHVDRALRAFLCAGIDTAGAVLRWGCQRVFEAVAGAPNEAHAVAAGAHTVAVPSAQPAAVVVLDHPDGGALPEGARQTVRFGLDGQGYELDLSDERATEMRSALQRYVDAGRRVGQEPGTRITSSSGRRRPRSAKEQRHDSAAIRGWARTQGHPVSDRGRIPAKLVEEYVAEYRRSRTLTTTK